MSDECDANLDKRLLIGLGTGRCGTVSLAKLLNMQYGSSVMHEANSADFKYRRKWLKHDDSKMCVDGSFQKANLMCYLSAFPGGGRFIGDVGYYYLAYIETILSLWPNVRFVCLWRNRQQTVESLMHKVEQTNRNPWQNHGGTQWSKAATYLCWPKFDDATTREDACCKYYDFYYAEARKFQEMFPSEFRIFQTGALNNSHGVERILDFCGFSQPVIAVGIHENRRQL